MGYTIFRQTQIDNQKFALKSGENRNSMEFRHMKSSKWVKVHISTTGLAGLEFQPIPDKVPTASFDFQETFMGH